MDKTPGDKISIQMDGEKEYPIGEDFSFTGTANVKSEKHQTRFEVDPAIVRRFEPMVVDYMPAAEVWDIAVASLMDRRGALPLSKTDAEKTLRELCDAAVWTQQAYLGQKVVTDQARGSFIHAKGTATTGKAASLKEAVLDPGKVIGMLKGWQQARLEGVSFRSFLDNQLVRFVNNENFPEEDRYYLVEILALKGFFKGREAKEFKVADLKQNVLDTWTGAKKAGTQEDAKDDTSNLKSLSPDAVVRLDPYGRFGRSLEAEAAELLSVDEPEVKLEDGPMIEMAREILGQDFLGLEAVREMESQLASVGVNVEFALDEIPELPYTPEDLELAKKNGEMLVLRPESMAVDGADSAITMMNFRELFKKDPRGALEFMVYSFRPDANDWYPNQKFANEVGHIKLRWALVTKECLPDSTTKTHADQDKVLKRYSEVLKSKGASNIDVTRRTGMEAFFDCMLRYINTGERSLSSVFDWTSSQTAVGGRVRVGFREKGLVVGRWHPGSPDVSLGVCAQR